MVDPLEDSLDTLNFLKLHTKFATSTFSERHCNVILIPRSFKESRFWIAVKIYMKNIVCSYELKSA